MVDATGLLLPVETVRNVTIEVVLVTDRELHAKDIL
jgi:hypothetical protein